MKPGELVAFEIALRADSLRSTKNDLDKNMHKALKAEQHPEIAFRLTTLGADAKKAVGVLRVAGVEREVTLDVTVTRRDATLVVSGQTAFLMTDFGITPPKAMLGMLKTDPKVTITFETVLSTSIQ
jgi:polyisoprenoid-binding protein YceI